MISKDGSSEMQRISEIDAHLEATRGDFRAARLGEWITLCRERDEISERLGNGVSTNQPKVDATQLALLVLLATTSWIIIVVAGFLAFSFAGLLD